MTNICFNCIHAAPDRKGHGCPWSRRFEPVPGWTAKPVKGVSNGCDTYEITDCPMFGHDGSKYLTESAPVRVRCRETGREYGSIYEAGRAIGNKGSGITSALKHGRTYAYGYNWEIITEEDEHEKTDP